MGYSMPSKDKIKKYWVEQLLSFEKFDSMHELMKKTIVLLADFYWAGQRDVTLGRVVLADLTRRRTFICCVIPVM